MSSKIILCGKMSIKKKLEKVSYNKDWEPSCLTQRIEAGFWNQGFHGYLGFRKALRAVSQVRDGRVGGLRRGSPRSSYNAGSAGL